MGNSQITNSCIGCGAYLKGLDNASNNAFHVLIPTDCARQCSSLPQELTSLEEGDSAQMVFTLLCFHRCTVRSRQWIAGVIGSGQ